MGLGSFMGGLTSGLKTGVDVQNSRKYANIYKQYADQSAEEFQMKKDDRAKEANKESDTWANVGKILTFNADGSSAPMGEAATQQPVMMNPDFKGMKGFARGGLVSLIPDAAMAGNAPAAYQVGGLASPPQPAAQSAPAQPQPSEGSDPKQELMKQMMDGSLANDPDKLSAIHAAFEQGGMGKTMGPWLERVYTAKKSGMIDGAMQLMRGQVDEAIDSLARGGIKLEDRPTQVDPKNPRVWRINISGAGEREVDIGDLLQTTLDPDKFLKHQNDTSESQGKRNVLDSTVRKHDSEVEVEKARAGKLRAETGNVFAERDGRQGGGLGRADRPEKIDAAVKRRDSTLDALSSDMGDDGKPFVNPQKRMMYSSLAVDAEDAISESLGRELTAKELHKLTDYLRTAPLGDAQGMGQWGAQLERAFGGGRKPTEPAQPQAPVRTAAAPAAAGLREAAASGPSVPVTPAAPARQGGLAGMREQQQMRDQMNAVQLALKAPNLSAEQKAALALKANEISNQINAYHGQR